MMISDSMVSFITGYIAGIFIESNRTQPNSGPFKIQTVEIPVDGDGNYQPEIVIVLGSGKKVRVAVEKIDDKT